jgi:S-DNA-T family DNA segregation ATPase FtsK/SpoIIIE
MEAGGVKIAGSLLLTASVCAALSFTPLRLFGGNIRIGGTLGFSLAAWLVDSLNVAGALLATATVGIVSIYLVSTFSLAMLGEWLARPLAWFSRRADAWRAWRERVNERALQKARVQAAERRTKSERRGTKAVAEPAPGPVGDTPPWNERAAAASDPEPEAEPQLEAQEEAEERSQRSPSARSKSSIRSLPPRRHVNLRRQSRGR